jgi:DNA-binding response OmpR family regulator
MTERKSVLIIDDDEFLLAALAEYLEGTGQFRVSTAGTATMGAMLATSRAARFDVIVMDVDLPDENGRELCARLRRHGLKIPIVILSGACDENDVVSGLEAGANDYVLKPFRMAELVARLRAQLRTFETSEDAEIQLGPFVFRPAARLLQKPGLRYPIRLTEKEAAVLKYLYRSRGRPVTRTALLHDVWGYSPAASTHTVETHIYRLRRKIESDEDTWRMVVNEDGGYRLCLDRTPVEMPIRRPMMEPAYLGAA